jgi:hypothetical protein
MSDIMKPTEDQAMAFCIMLQTGLPAEQAMLYFTDTNDPAELNQMVKAWLRSHAVARAQRELMGKSWQEMTLDERIGKSLEQHYASLAYLLFSTNYCTVQGTEKSKLDSAREALERKVAGTSGKGDELQRFMDDLRSGKLQMSKPVKPAIAALN